MVEYQNHKHSFDRFNSRGQSMCRCGLSEEHYNHIMDIRASNGLDEKDYEEGRFQRGITKKELFASLRKRKKK